MKTFLLLLLIGLSRVVLFAAPDISGKWEIESTFDDTSLAAGGFDCTFQQDGEHFTGKCSGGTVEASGEVNGTKVTWQIGPAAGTQTEGPRLTFTGTLDEAATRIVGRFVIGDKGGSFTAYKQ